MHKRKILLLAVIGTLSCLFTALALTPWFKEPWTESEKSYYEARVAVDKVRDNKVALSALVSKWEPRTKEKPFERLSQYRWGYALYWLTRAKYGESSDYIATKEYGAIRDALTRSTFRDSVPPDWRSRSYEFNRLRFWVEQRSGFPLWKLGERVLRRNPKDVETQNSLLKIWTISCPPPQKADALVLLETVSKRYPNDPITTYWKARIYSSVYSANVHRYGVPNSVDANKAIESYERFLREAADKPQYARERKLTKMFVENVKFLSAHNS